MGTRAMAARLAEERRRAFVGREPELALFAQALESSAFAVLFVHGPGGVGKSTLLARFEDEARERQRPCARIDATTLLPRASASLPPALGVDTLEALSDRPRVILIDTYEELAPPDDDWIREALLPALAEGSVLVLAGRDPPRAAWRTDAGVAALSRVRALQNLDASESARLLRARGVTEPLATAHALTHGHPLALVLVAELARERGLGEVPSLTPDVVRELLDRILRALPDPAHREALEVAALARVTTEALLTELGVEPAGSLFAWLRARSFMSERDDGVAPHDLVRDAIIHDLAFRDPTRAEELRRRIAERNRRVLLEREGRARERAYYDALFAMRESPAMRPFFDWQRGESGAARPLAERELDEVLAAITEHEGEDAARIAAAWWARQPEAFIALLDRDDAWIGTLVYLRFDAVAALDVVADPAIDAASAVMAAAPPRGGEHVRVLRFWIWRDGYQDPGSAAHGPHSMVVALDWMFATALAWCVLVVQRVDPWRRFFGPLGFDEREEASFALGARRFHVFTRDFRAVPWTAPIVKDAAPTPPRTTRRVLAEDEFADAVRAALKSATRPAELLASPLLGTRLLAEWAEDEAPTPEMIRELLEVAASSLDDEDDRPRRCVELAYLSPAPTHEHAAEQLGLSYSTFRRQLARGVDRVVAYLFDREVRGPRR